MMPATTLISASVLETSGDCFSVQLRNKAFKSVFDAI
jgi:hypothetical protein